MKYGVDAPARYDCEHCGHRARLGVPAPTCPDCGRRMRNVAVPRE